MSTFLTILLIILAFFGGMLAGMYLLRKQFEKEFASNPRLNVEAVRTLLGASGQRPSEAKVQQVGFGCRRVNRCSRIDAATSP